MIGRFTIVIGMYSTYEYLEIFMMIYDLAFVHITSRSKRIPINNLSMNWVLIWIHIISNNFRITIVNLLNKLDWLWIYNIESHRIWENKVDKKLLILKTKTDCQGLMDHIQFALSTRKFLAILIWFCLDCTSIFNICAGCF